MKVYDLTHVISSDTMVYPGTEPALLTTANTLQKDGFRETLLHMSSHTGTHMDAPAHMTAQGQCLDEKDVARFLGRAWVLDCSPLGPGGQITEEMLRAIPGLEEAEFLLLHTGWDRHWDSPDYFGDFPVLTLPAARYAASLGLKGIGVDAMSVDPMDSTAFPVHHVLFSHDMVSVENLRGLGQLCGQAVTFAALPLHFQQADGAPVRAVAWVD